MLIGMQRGCSIASLVREIDRTRRLKPPRSSKWRVRSLSSAVRIFVLESLSGAYRANRL
jgi:predicted DNA-binding ribbon-helix-helix protein